MLLQDLVGEVDLVALPLVGADRHVFDEAHLQAVLAGEPGQRHDVVLGDAADADGVDLDRVEAGRLGGVDAVDAPARARRGG